MALDQKQQSPSDYGPLSAAIERKDAIEVDRILRHDFGHDRGTVAAFCRREIKKLMHREKPLDAEEDKILRRLVENVYLLGDDPHADITKSTGHWHWGNFNQKKVTAAVYDSDGDLLYGVHLDLLIPPAHAFLQHIQNSFMALLLQRKEKKNWGAWNDVSDGPQYFPLKAYVDRLNPEEAKHELHKDVGDLKNPPDDKRTLLSGTLILLAAKENKIHYFQELISPYFLTPIKSCPAPLKLTRATLWNGYGRNFDPPTTLYNEQANTKSNNLVTVLLQPIEVELSVLIRLMEEPKRAEYLAMLAAIRVSLTQQVAENLANTLYEIENLRKIAAYAAAVQDMVSSFTTNSRPADERKAAYINVLAKADALPFASATEKKWIFGVTVGLFLFLTTLTTSLLFEPTFYIEALDSIYDDAGRYLIGALSIYVTVSSVLAAYLKHSDSLAGPCTKSAIRFFNTSQSTPKTGLVDMLVDAAVGEAAPA